MILIVSIRLLFSAAMITGMQGREISLEVYEGEHKAPPLLMGETAMGTENT
jgi:hypothetical protein